MVDIKKFWIEGILLEKYPNFHADQGADIDGNGKIEGSEAFGDLNGDGSPGDREDYQIYLQNNRTKLGNDIPFFKWGEGLSVKNRIHQLIYLESDLYPHLIQSAYVFLTNLVRETDKRIGNRNLPAEYESRIYYDAMRAAGITFKNQDNSSFVKNVEERQLDCDSSSYTAMAIGDERGNTLRPVVLPGHVFLRGLDKYYTEFNIDIGETTTDEDYKKDAFYGLDAALLSQGFYLQTLDDEHLEGLFLVNRGNVLEKLRRYREALKAYDRAIDINPKDAGARNNRGSVLEKLGRYPEALKAYDRAIDINPKNAIAHINRGNVLEKLGRYPEALKAYDRAIDINPKHAIAHYNRGIILEKLGRYQEALKAYDRAIDIDPKKANAHIVRGNVLGKLGQYQKALKTYDWAIDINPKNAGAHNNRGNVLEKFGRYREALEAYDRAIKINPNHANAHFNRGIILEKLGWYYEAIKSFEEARRLNPDFKVKLTGLRNRLKIQRFISKYF